MRRFASDESGQTVVIVALLFVMILGFTGLAIDGGRFYTERRFLQNAADAAALGCANRLLATGNATTAEDTGKEILRAYNLQNDPTGTTVVVPDAPVYTTWYNAADPTDKRNLYEGVDAYTKSCRVAVRASMHTFFMGMLGFQDIDLSAYAHAAAKGGMLPVVVNRYKDPPGPSSTFLDYSKEEQHQIDNPNVCGENDIGSCPNAARSELGCTTGCVWGPETVIVGNGYNSSDSDFRGFIALDIRDFTTVDGNGNSIHEYYNGVTGGMNVNTLKDIEAAYIASGGYPGPNLVPYIPNSNPVQKGLQIATMAGNSSGIVVTNFERYYDPGHEILVQYFDGQVREIPDFTINPPSAISANSPSGPANGPTFRVGANQRFRADGDTVDLEMVRDTYNNGTANDTPAALHDFTFDPADPFTPAGGSGTQVDIENLQVDAGLASGIYSVIIKGTGYNNPNNVVLATHQAWVPLNVGGVTKDFEMDFVATTVEVDTGTSAVFTFELKTGSGAAAWGSSAVSFAIDQGTCNAGSIALVTSATPPATVCGTATLSPATAVPSKNSPPTVTITVPTGGAVGQGSYTMVLRGRGTNSSSQPVVHVQPLVLAVGTTAGGSTDKYVNVQGYGVFMITSVTSNTVSGRAITGYFADPDDAAANVARRAGLLPWEVAPY